jgi:hypothetical protein
MAAYVRDVPGFDVDVTHGERRGLKPGSSPASRGHKPEETLAFAFPIHNGIELFSFERRTIFMKCGEVCNG